MNEIFKKTFTLTATFILISMFLATAQQNNILKYYDELWNVVPKDSAFFYADFAPEKDGYKCTAWWMGSKKLHAISFQSDTLFTKSMGLFRRYYETGQLQDSSYFDPQSGTLVSTFYYYNTGKLWAKYSYNAKTKIDKSEGYDENGKRIEDFVYQREAEFRNGTADWVDYLGNNLKSNTPVKKAAPKGSYQIVIRFIVLPNGSVSNVVAETNLGYGMEEEGIRVIKKSPKWSPAILLNKGVNAYRRQPLTFVVEEK